MINKNTSCFIVIAVYFFAISSCSIASIIIPVDDPIYKVLLLDIFGTVIIFCFSLIFNNSSMYDPYWSIAPLPILIYWGMDQNNLHLVQFIIISLVFVWGLRLTFNFFRRWDGIQHEDWRYKQFRNKPVFLYWVISFFGFHLFPTILVFLGCLSLYPVMTSSFNTPHLNTIFAVAITLAAIIIESVSDQQLRKFAKTNSNKEAFIQTGLWKYSRHPNYFGEVLFWIGLSVFSMNAAYFEWYVIIGPLCMLLLFRFISIPMLEKKVVAYKNGYQEYMNKTSILIPFILRSRK
jgi:steroid 5-alpha reductase family enzyme